MIRICLFTSILLSSTAFGEPNHIKSFSTKAFNQVDFEPQGCRTKVGGALLKGGVTVCQSSKPLKRTMSSSKIGKSICGAGYSICHETDKPMMKLLKSQNHRVPYGCYAFASSRSKSKAAGIGRNCNNLFYYNGALCCPQHEKKHPTFQKGIDEKEYFLKSNGLANYLRKK